eukprot:1161796-Pelagomonas_calceolata.AAC.12
MGRGRGWRQAAGRTQHAPGPFKRLADAQLNGQPGVLEQARTLQRLQDAHACVWHDICRSACTTWRVCARHTHHTCTTCASSMHNMRVILAQYAHPSTTCAPVNNMRIFQLACAYLNALSSLHACMNTSS